MPFAMHSSFTGPNVIAPAIRPTALHDLKELARTTEPELAKAESSDRRVPVPTLPGLSGEQIEKLRDHARGSFAWVNDGLCLFRARTEAEAGHRLLTGKSSLDVEQPMLGVALAEPSQRVSDLFDGWSFHAAATFRDARDGQLYVLDSVLSPDTGIMPLKDWRAAIEASPASSRIQHPLADYASDLRRSADEVDDPVLETRNFSKEVRELAKTIRSERGRISDEIRSPGSGVTT